MYSKTIVCFFMVISISCKHGNSQMKDVSTTKVNTENKPKAVLFTNPYETISSIPIPDGYKRPPEDQHSFSTWLGQIHLKSDRSVYLFDSTKKANQLAQFAVLDIPVGDRDLQQCADAIMRLRASYFFDKKEYDSILFFDNDHKAYRFSKPYNQEHFNDYLKTVFEMCGTASLSKQLKKINFKDIRPGDVLIRGGFPGHAVMVVDMVINEKGEKKYMLAQSYMPAQDIHILLNPHVAIASPWYQVSDADKIETPEYTFTSDEWKRW